MNYFIIIILTWIGHPVYLLVFLLFTFMVHESPEHAHGTHCHIRVPGVHLAQVNAETFLMTNPQRGIIVGDCVSNVTLCTNTKY